MSKHSIIFVILLLICLLFTSCKPSSPDDSTTPSTEAVTSVTDIVAEQLKDKTQYLFYYINERTRFDDPDDAPDVDYTADELNCHTDSTSYSIHDDKIKIYVNFNKDERDSYPVLLLFDRLAVDRLNNGEWERGYYFSENFPHDIWIPIPYTEEKGYGTEPFKYLNLDNLYPQSVPGHYRVAVFLGKGVTLYSEFDLTD